MRTNYTFRDWSFFYNGGGGGFGVGVKIISPFERKSPRLTIDQRGGKKIPPSPLLLKNDYSLR